MSSDGDEKQGGVAAAVDETKRFADLALQAGSVFLPSAPIKVRRLFAGRLRQLHAVMDALAAPGQHVVIYGERGVGKTSLAAIVEILASENGIGVNQTCQTEDSFGTLWRDAFESVKYAQQTEGFGFASPPSQRLKNLGEKLPENPTPRDVVAALRAINVPIVFVFDEFDQLKMSEVAQAFAETIKALSDHTTSSKVVLVGVGDSIDQLIARHTSIERAIVQVHMPRMNDEELHEIIATGSTSLGMTWDDDAAKRVVRLSQGLPHYVHRLALFATRGALRSHSLSVAMEEVKVGMRETIASAAQSLTDVYLKATTSQRKDSLFGPVLLACALSPSDDLGYFRPAWLKPSLRAMGHDLDVPVFSSHLNKFTSAERGGVLEKTGTDRQWRYRFRNPLLQPYVIMRGLSEDAVSIAIVDPVLKRDPARRLTDSAVNSSQ
jgi:DNA transposition AAA+ family ATPase